jgi:iron complex transport system substrate-binding protein
MTANSQFPERIVCLTEETTETLYLLGEDWRIVGISGFTVRPPRAARGRASLRSRARAPGASSS